MCSPSTSARVLLPASIVAREGRNPPRESRELAANQRVELPDEVVGELEDVLAPIAQRWDVDSEDVETVKEIGSKAAVRNCVVQITVTGDDEADIGRDLANASDPPEGPCFHRLEQLALGLQVELRDLVEKHRPAVGHLEQTGFPARRAGEGALLVTEEFGLDQRLGQTGTIDVGEWT